MKNANITAIIATMTEGREYVANIDSSAIRSILAVFYASGTEKVELVIEFVSGGSYGYIVPVDVFKSFLASESKGRAYHTLIRGKYTAERMD